MDTNVMELIERDIDGEISGEERARLAEIKAGDASVRRAYEELAATARAVSSLSMVEPPPQLRERIMQALPQPQPVSEGSIHSWLAAFRETFVRRPVLGYAWTLALGVFIGIAAITVYQNAIPESRLVTGTIGAPGIVVDQLAIEAPGVRGMLRLTEEGQSASLEVSIESEYPVDLELAYVESDLVLRDVQRLGSAPPAIGADGGTILLAVEERAAYRLAFDRLSPDTPAVRVRILREGQLAFENRIPSSDR